MCDGLQLLPCVGPACLPVNKCPNAPRSLSGAASLALLPVLSSRPRRFSPPSDYRVHSSRREVGVLGEQSQPSRAFHAPLSAPHDEATGPQTLHIKPAQAPGLEDCESKASLNVQRNRQPAGEKANSFLEKKEGHPASESLDAEARGASGKEAAPSWCPEDGQKEAACLTWQEVLKVNKKDQLLQVAFWNQRGARFSFAHRSHVWKGGAYPESWRRWPSP